MGGGGGGSHAFMQAPDRCIHTFRSCHSDLTHFSAGKSLCSAPSFAAGQLLSRRRSALIVSIGSDQEATQAKHRACSPTRRAGSTRKRAGEQAPGLGPRLCDVVFYPEAVHISKPPPACRCHSRPPPPPAAKHCCASRTSPPAAMAAVRAQELTLKSPADKKSYRIVTLANGLQALLVHDPEIDLAAAAAQPAGPPPHAEVPSEEDVDSLLSGDEGEDSGSEVRLHWGAWSWSEARPAAVAAAAAHVGWQVGARTAWQPAGTNIATLDPCPAGRRGGQQRQRGWRGARARASPPQPAGARRRRRGQEGGGRAVGGGGPLHRPLASAGKQGQGLVVVACCCCLVTWQAPAVAHNRFAGAQVSCGFLLTHCVSNNC